ncbi:MAG: FAD-dependent oxidoreductase [Gammaproteobacteria bacterium]|nr:FAD-dependent oxidoreductase [Gammaproteobacteria bacterium]
MAETRLQFSGYEFAQLFDAAHLARLDAEFIASLKAKDSALCQQLQDYRSQSQPFTREDTSQLLISAAEHLSAFLTAFFNIDQPVENLKSTILRDAVIFQFKENIVLRMAKRKVSNHNIKVSFNDLNQWVMDNIESDFDIEWGVAEFAVNLLKTESPEIERLVDWCVLALSTDEGQQAVQGWASFKLPAKLDYQNLVNLDPVPEDPYQRVEGPESHQRQRDGFSLTDEGMSRREVLSEVHYCVNCHTNEGDFCSQGFPVKKREPELGLKKNPLDEYMTGCPLEEKISEMHALYRGGDVLGALAMVMVDNPMCPATGHRICNDCMKACIYQKQDPVDIPQIESRVLKDVLSLPWGVEIYDLLTRWNPLRKTQWVMKPYNGLKIMVMGMGPAGFTLAHHLTMEGCAVIGVEGLKIEPVDKDTVTQPIQDFASIKEDLSERILAGFGGVAEYGITVRWDKNFLKLIYLCLLRRPYFSVYGGVRFGGTFNVEDVWELGCDHLAVAVGAGLPRELNIPGSMATGMRQANDFLMALQLTGAAKKSSLANLQVRMPAVIIGGGLTGIDTATEVQAYYITQVEKILARYEILVQKSGREVVDQHFPEVDATILQEFLAHGREVRAEREKANQEGRAPDFIRLLREWGGVTIVYRRKLHDSPAYRRNHEEVEKALEEGIFYAESLNPVAARLDSQGHVTALVCERVDENSNEVVLPARAILVATGAKPNIAYEFEHRGTFHREGMEYRAYSENENGHLHDAGPPSQEHVKTKEFGAFTSYQQEGYRVSFLGDTHPVFHGSVVKAIASAGRIYPKIIKSLQVKDKNIHDISDYENFEKKIQNLFTATVTKVKRHTATVIEVDIYAPMAARNFKPGQFYRVQNYETTAPLVGGTRLQSEAMAMIGAKVDKETGKIALMVFEQGASSRLFAMFKPGDPISIMGPTGVRTEIPKDRGTVMVIGGRMGAAHIQAVGPALKAAGHRVIYIAGFRNHEEVYCQDELESAADAIFWITEQGEPVPSRRPVDVSATGDFLTLLVQYANGELIPKKPLGIGFDEVNRVLVIGTKKLVKIIQTARSNELKTFFRADTQFIASIYGPMQCMLKGVCAQCLQWQVNPLTGQRTKAVYACSWQDQPLDIVDLDNLSERLAQNSTQEILSNLWLDYLFAEYNVERV